MKKICIKLKPKSIPKESEEERKERLKYWSTTRTRVKESKKVYNRKKFKKPI